MPRFRSTSFVEPDDVRQLPGADLRVVDLDEVAVGLARSARGWHRRVFIVIFIALSAIAMAACGGSAASPAVQKVDASKAVGMLDSRVVVDVRTAAEYAAGHIAGAKNIDVEAADFCVEDLDPRQDGGVPRLLPLGPAECDRCSTDGGCWLHRHR